MAARKTTVTHADGTVSTRKSQRAIYTHAVEVGPAPADTYAAVLDRRANRLDAEAATLRAAADRGDVRIVDRRLGGRSANSLHSHEAILMGPKTARGNYSRTTWCSADGKTEDFTGTRPADGNWPVVDVVAYLIDYARRAADSLTAKAVEDRARAAQIRAAGTPVGEYYVVRWSSRFDLATKALSEFAHIAATGCTVRVVPVDAA